MRIAQNQMCVIYLIFKINFLNKNHCYINFVFIFSLIITTCVYQGSVDF